MGILKYLLNNLNKDVLFTSQEIKFVYVSAGTIFQHTHCYHYSPSDFSILILFMSLKSDSTTYLDNKSEAAIQ